MCVCMIYVAEWCEIVPFDPHKTCKDKFWKRSKISWSGSPDIIGAPGRPGRPGRPGSNMGLATLGRPSRASLLFVTVARLVTQCDVTAMFWGWHCPKHALKKAGNFSTKGHKNNVNHSHHLWWNYEVDLWIIEGIYSSCMLGIEAGSRRWCKTSDEYVLCLSTQSSNWTKSHHDLVAGYTLPCSSWNDTTQHNIT